jgi:pSer/pThr/pTyr-binding forkhead associated (FHA) protein
MSLSPNAWRMHLTSAHGSAREIEILDRPLVAGAAPGCDIPIDERFVSGEHFKVELTNQRLYVTDLGSRNGTYIGSLRLPPHTPTEWQPGAPLLIADAVRAELLPPLVPVAPNGASYVLPQRPTNALPYVAPAAPVTMLEMALSTPVLSPGQLATLTLNYRSGGQTRAVINSAVQGEGIACAVVPGEAYLAPGVPLTAQVTVRRLKPFYFGGRVPVQFSARTDDGAYARVAAEVRLRPRYEYLLLLLLPLLLCVASVAFAINPITIQPLPTETLTPTVTPTNTPAPTSTDAIIGVPTSTSAPTLAPSFTPLPQCVNRCAALGWSAYTIQPGDTLFSLGLAGNVSAAQVAQVNCIAESSTIYAGQQICLPVVRPISTPVPALTCDGFRPTAPTAFAQGMTTFYWDAPRAFTPSAYRLSIYNADSGALVFQREQAPPATNMQVDTAAISGAFRFFWTIDALVNGGVFCTGRVDALREAPTNQPPTVVPPQVVLSLTDADSSGFFTIQGTGYDVVLFVTAILNLSNVGTLTANTVDVTITVAVDYYQLQTANRVPVSDSETVPILDLAPGNQVPINVQFRFERYVDNLEIGTCNDDTFFTINASAVSSPIQAVSATLSIPMSDSLSQYC